MPVPTNLHSLILGALMAAALALALGKVGLAFGAPEPWMPLPDWEIGWALRAALGVGLVHLAIFSLGHVLFRRLGMGAVAAYAGLGALACLVAFALVLPLSDWTGIVRGTRLAAIVGGMGAIVGVLYWFHARYAAGGWPNRGRPRDASVTPR